MAKKKGFNELLDTALGNDDRLTGMLQDLSGPKPVAETAAPRPQGTSRKKATVAQRKVVEGVRNAQRGRGKKKEGRKMIAFQAREELADQVEELMFVLGKTKNELYNEALEDLVTKYQNV